MIERSFACVRGIGPARERELRQRGIERWSDFPGDGNVLSTRLDAAVRARVGEVARWQAEGRYDELWSAFPGRESWRFIPLLEQEATYLDIETTFDGRVTVIGCYSLRSGPRLFVRGFNLGDFVREPLAPAIITFNGASFDVPILARTFPGWAPPAIHLDLLRATARLGERGGLKAIEQRWGLGRPEHLAGLGGAEAPVLWGAFARRRDTAALHRLLEYNLYDVIQLRAVAQKACERLARRDGTTWLPPAPFERGDVLYDLSRELLRVVAEAGRIEPDAFHEEERAALRG